MKNIKIRYDHFWEGFNISEQENFFITKYFDKVEITTSDDYDILILSVFPRNNIKVNSSAKIILFNGEHPNYIINFINVTGIKPDILMGFTDIPKSVLDKIYGDKLQLQLPLILYYPLWILYYDKIFSQEYFDKKNKECKNISKDEFLKKRLCCLINSHDNNNTRKPVYNFIVNNNGEVDCAGKLLNNIDRKLVGVTSEDKLRFMNNYKLNICSENNYGLGYVTEKMPQSMDAACIPVYIGCDNTQKINYKIFNKERIIFINDNFESLKKLLDSPDELYEMYKKPIFVENSYEYLKKYMELTKNILIKKFIF
jgi:hypothetical protein